MGLSTLVSSARSNQSIAQSAFGVACVIAATVLIVVPLVGLNCVARNLDPILLDESGANQWKVNWTTGFPVSLQPINSQSPPSLHEFIAVNSSVKNIPILMLNFLFVFIGGIAVFLRLFRLQRRFNFSRRIGLANLLCILTAMCATFAVFRAFDWLPVLMHAFYIIWTVTSFFLCVYLGSMATLWCLGLAGNESRLQRR